VAGPTRPRETQVKLETRITPANLKVFNKTKRRLLRLVRIGKLSYDEATRQMADANQDLIEWRITPLKGHPGPWRPLREAGKHAAPTAADHPVVVPGVCAG
jgi:hypothetical protein